MRRNVCADDGAAQSKCLEEDTGQTLGEARQRQGPSGQQFLQNSLVAEIAGDSHSSLQVKLLDQPFNFTAHGTVAHDDEFEINLAIPKLGSRLDQDGLSFLFND